MRRSTSAGLYNGDTALPASGGWHGYVLVLDGSDNARFLKTLHERCWLNGFGWFKISESGSLLERSMIDKAVAPPEHLIFEGPPTVKKPLRQDAETRRPIAYTGETLDTRVACPDLTPVEQETVAALKAKAKEAMQPEADRVRAAYVEERAEEMVKRTGMSKSDAVKAIESQCNGVLSEHVVLEFSNTKFKGCTVGDVLDDPERFARASLADPIEGSSYKSGRTCAMVMLRRDNDYPWIKSFAHGGERSFTLVRNPGDELKPDFPGRIPDYAQKKPGTVLQTSTGNNVVVPDWRERNRYFRPVPSMHNAWLAIKALGIVCRYDSFHNKLLFGYRDDAAPPNTLSVMLGEVTDYGIIRLRKIMSDIFGFDMKDAATRDAVVAMAMDHCFDPVRDMLDQAEGEWDGVKRLDRMAVTYFNCEDTPLNRAIVRKTMIAAVRRVRKPGCKFDNITVMESAEGWNKSTVWRVLAGDENFSDASILGHGAREVQEQLSEVWIHENADLAGMKKAEVEAVKAFASRQSDDARPAYGHFLKKQKRHSIDVGTTNSDEYLQSQTGNRRFWPLKLLTPIDIEPLQRDRLQLWGEAAKYEAAGESIVLDKKLWPEVTEEQEKRRVKDPWEDILNNIPSHASFDDVYGRVKLIDLKEGGAAYSHYIQIRHRESLGLNNWREVVASVELLRYVLNVPVHQQTKAHSMRLAETMKKLGWKSDRIYINKIQVRAYYRAIDAAAAKSYNWVVKEPAVRKVEPIEVAGTNQPAQERQAPRKPAGKVKNAGGGK
jgi:predicted P-loop ATPase